MNRVTGNGGVCFKARDPKALGAWYRRMPQEVQDALAANVPFPSRLGTSAEDAKRVQAVVTKEMLNCEVIRLDGATRRAPK